MKSCAKLQKIIHITKLNFKIMKTDFLMKYEDLVRKMVVVYTQKNKFQVKKISKSDKKWTILYESNNAHNAYETFHLLLHNYLKIYI